MMVKWRRSSSTADNLANLGELWRGNERVRSCLTQSLSDGHKAEATENIELFADRRREVRVGKSKDSAPSRGGDNAGGKVPAEICYVAGKIKTCFWQKLRLYIYSSTPNCVNVLSAPFLIQPAPKKFVKPRQETPSRPFTTCFNLFKINKPRVIASVASERWSWAVVIG